jgi:Ca-activated chloride channel family protein
MGTLAETTGGQYYEADSLAELTAVYQDMGSSVGHRVVPREITQWYLGGALVLALMAGTLSLLWTPRLP